MALTGKTIGELNLLQFPTNDTLIPVEYSGDTYHIVFSSITYNEGTYSQFVSGDFLPISGGTVTGNTIFTSGLTANTISGTTYQNLPVSGVTGATGISANTINGLVTIINTSPDQIVTITGGTNIQINGTYPNFGINFTGSTGVQGNFLALSGGTVTGNTIFTNGLTANTISATTYQNLPIENNLTPSTTVAPSKTAVNTAISPTTGVTFNGSAISLDKVTGTSYLPYTQVSAITFTLSGASVGLGFAVISITANGSAITPIASWKNVGNDVISVVNGAVNRFIITQVENEVWYTVKVN